MVGKKTENSETHTQHKGNNRTKPEVITSEKRKGRKQKKGRVEHCCLVLFGTQTHIDFQFPHLDTSQYTEIHGQAARSEF